MRQSSLRILFYDKRVPAIAGTRPTAATVLTEMGHDVVLTRDAEFAPNAFDVVLMWGNPGYFPRLRDQLIATPVGQRPLVVLVHHEPLPPPRASGLPRFTLLSPAEIAKICFGDWRATDIYTNAFKLRRMMREGSIDLLFASSAEKVEYAHEQGYEAVHTQYGYHKSLGGIMDLERDIDVLFLGDTRPLRRKRLLGRLRRSGINITVRGSWHDSSGWGESRTLLLNRTKIIVHIQRYPGKLASKRFVLAMTNGAMVVAEPPYLPAPFVNGAHYIEARVGEMPDVIRHYLHNPTERERITKAAHRLVTEELTFESSMRTMLEAISKRLGGKASELATAGPAA